MARSANQKKKLLYLRQMLERVSDENHPVTVQEMVEELERYGIRAERKSIYDDMQALREFGLDVQSRKGRAPGWFLGQRDFELPELKLLVDAVQSSRFITRRKSDALIHKLEGLTNIYQAKQLQRQVYVDRRAKTMNESIYYNVDKLHAAISQGRKITFRYFDYDVHKDKVFHRDGGRYLVSPYGLVWNSENYYLVSLDDEHRDIRHYRVDKMADIAVTCLVRESPGEYSRFDMAAYAQKHFGMFSGREERVTLRCENRLVGVVLDRFGQDTILIPDGGEHFSLTLPVVVSPQFFGWLFALGGGVTLTAPKRAAEEYRQALRSVSALYAE